MPDKTPTPEEIVKLIESLPAKERDRLFVLLARHPENKHMQEYNSVAFELLEFGEEIIKRFTRGPKKLAEIARHRRERIKMLMASGETRAEVIRRKLKEMKIDVELQTVRNDMTKIRHAKS